MTKGQRRDILDMAKKAVSRVLEKLGKSEEGKGGYFRLFQTENPQEGFIGMVLVCEGWVGGHANSSKSRKYWIVSLEKALRLAEKAALYGDVASKQSKNEPANQYPGAVRIVCASGDTSNPSWFILSFSGLPPEADEAVTIAVAAAMNAKPCEIEKLIRVTENQLAWDLVRDMRPEMDIDPRPARLF